MDLQILMNKLKPSLNNQISRDKYDFTVQRISRRLPTLSSDKVRLLSILLSSQNVDDFTNEEIEYLSLYPLSKLEMYGLEKVKFPNGSLFDTGSTRIYSLAPDVSTLSTMSILSPSEILVELPGGWDG